MEGRTLDEDAALADLAACACVHEQAQDGQDLAACHLLRAHLRRQHRQGLTTIIISINI